MLRRRGLTEERLWLTKLYAGHRYIQSMHRAMLKISSAVLAVEDMPTGTQEEREARWLAYREALSA